jgi:hypothetical protein
MDGYHAAFTHERFFTKFMPAMGLDEPLFARSDPLPMPPGNGHVGGFPGGQGIRADTAYLEKFAPEPLAEFRKGLVERVGADKAPMIEGGSSNYLIFPNLIVIDGWKVFRTFYPSSPGYMEITGWACLPKEDPPALRKARLEWYMGFQGPGGFATPDDVEGLEGCQMAFSTVKEVEWSDLSRSMGGNPHGPTEEHLRGFWREWHARLTTGKHADTHLD